MAHAPGFWAPKWKFSQYGGFMFRHDGRPNSGFTVARFPQLAIALDVHDGTRTENL